MLTRALSSPVDIHHYEADSCAALAASLLLAQVRYTQRRDAHHDNATAVPELTCKALSALEKQSNALSAFLAACRDICLLPRRVWCIPGRLPNCHVLANVSMAF